MLLDELTRDEREHWVGHGRLLTVSSVEYLTPREFSELPDDAAELLEGWRARLDALPERLSFTRELLQSRTPLLERAQFDDRVYWTVRLAGWGVASPLEHPCLGGTGERLARSDLPEPLGWLARTFGHATLVAEQSGTAPFGRPLRDFLANGELLVESPPDGSDDWVALYECDGDAIFADLATGAAWWLGHEWTGDEATALRVPWPTVAVFILWRMLDGGYVRPWDLEMLAAARAR